MKNESFATDIRPGFHVLRLRGEVQRDARVRALLSLQKRGAHLTLQDFIAEWDGRGVNPNGENPYGFQCVEVSNQWCRELGIEMFGGNAADFVGDPHPDCDWIPNTPSGVPSPGDVVVWGPMPGDPYGHTGVFVSGDAGAFTSFDQNWPLTSLAHVQAHDWNYVVGWYHPRILDQPAGTWLGTIDADGGARVHTLPGTDQPLVPQPGANPDVVDKGTVLVLTAWCRHPPAIPDAVTSEPDDRWFRTDSGHWVASAVVNGNPPAGILESPDPAAPAPAPAPTPPSPAPVPAPAPPFTGDPLALKGRWVWEWNDQADYALLAKLGFTGVLIRAANGDGGGFDATFQAAWRQRAPAARAAGLKVVAWTYWYGPGDAGYTETNPTAYLQRCADHTAGLGFDTPMWVIDFEAKDATGLPAACRALRTASGKAVTVAPPGDPGEYGIDGWPWRDLDAAVDAYLPQMYTGAWSAISLQQAYAEWTLSPPIFPAGDEQDPVKARAWVEGVKGKKATGWSAWRAGVLSSDALAAYAEATIPPSPTPLPGPTPSPAPPPVPPPSPTPGSKGHGCLAALPVMLLRALHLME